MKIVSFPLSFALILLLAIVPGAFAQTEEPAEEPAVTFGENIEVTAVELMLDVRDKKGQLPAGLTLADFEVFEDGKPVQVLGLDYPEGWRADGGEEKAAPAESAPAEPAPAARRPWRTLIYVDGVLVSVGSLHRTVDTLRKRLPQLVEQGPVEIVFSNPLPAILTPFTTDLERLDRALAILGKDVQPANEVETIRRDFIRERDRRYALTGISQDETAREVRNAAEREHFVLLRQMGVFMDWMKIYGYDPGAVLLVSDGFDVDPADFYLDAVSNPAPNLAGDLMRFQLDRQVEEVGKSLSAQGWTSYILATGAMRSPVGSDATVPNRERFRSIADGGSADAASNSALVEYPLEPLKATAEATGGEVLTIPKKILQALERVGEKLRLTYQAQRGNDGERHEIEIRLKDAKKRKLELRAPRWITAATPAQVAESRVRRMLVNDGEVGELPVDVALQAVGEKRQDAQPTEIAVTFDLNQLKPLLTEGTIPLRFTFGVEIANSPPFVHQVVEDVRLPSTEGGDSFPSFLYKMVLAMPPEARRVSVVVEEPASGFWGGSVSQGTEGRMNADRNEETQP